MPTHAPKKPIDPFADIAEPVSASDPFADIAEPVSGAQQVDFTANPKREGTYKMVAPSDNGAINLIDIPYSQVGNAYAAGYRLGQSGDSQRYASDKFTEINKTGETVNPNIDYAGITPTPARGSKEWWKDTGKSAVHKTLGLLPTAGAAVFGGLAGGLGLETGPADIAIASGAAGIGASGGEAMRQELEEKLFPNQTKLTPEESIRGIGIQGAFGAMGEGSGRALSNFVFRPPIQSLRNTVTESAKFGIRRLPSEAAGRAPTWMEEFLKGSVLSRGIMERFREVQNKEAIDAANKLMDSISSFKGTPEQLGKIVQKGLDDSEAALRAEQNLLYGGLDNITEQVVIPPKPKFTIVLNKNGKPLLDKAGRPVMKQVMQPGTTRVMPSMTGLKDFAREQLEKINKPPYFLPKDVAEKSRDAFNTILRNPDHVSFKRMRDMRSVLLSQVRDLDQAMGGSKLGLAKKFETLTDQSLEDAAKKSGIPGLYNRWRQANEITAEGHRMFEQKLVEKVAETNDPEFIASLLGGNKIGIQQTRDLFKALPEKIHDPVRRGLLEDAVAKATEPRSGAFDEGKFATSIDKIGDERGKIIFGPNWKNIKELADIMGKINGPVGLGRGGGAALQNIGVMKKLGSIALGGGPELLALAAGTGTGHLMEAAQGIATEAATARIVAWGMTRPATAVKMLDGMRILAKMVPYVATGTLNETIGYQKGLDRIKEQAKKLQEKSAPQPSIPPPAAPVPQYQFAPDGSVIPLDDAGPQSKNKPVWTHVFNPSTGEIEAT